MITETLLELGRKHRSVVLFLDPSLDPAIKAPLQHWFGDRCLDVSGGATHVMGQVAGYALTGKTPFVLANQDFYLDFLGRGFRSLIAGPALNVKLISFLRRDHAATHPSLLDGVSICPNAPEALPASVVSMMAAYGSVYLEVPLAI